MTTAKKAERVLILHPSFKRVKSSRTDKAALEEAVGLATAINVDVVATEVVPIDRVIPSTYLGSGKVAAIADRIKHDAIDVVLFNGQLSPIQQRNLEKGCACKLIDRTALILEIFGERARTKEGKLQVELAALEYQKSRLVRSWTHLERQRGGAGFMGGPGERQIESDRRLISKRITKLKRQLEQVRKTRTLHRKSRSKVPYPIVALVGYTNAGKTTLFNHLTKAESYAADALFATLDPLMRVISLPSGTKAILADTVGFIADLPTELVASFRATLEEVTEADIILHVRDITHIDSDQQKHDVEKILKALGIDTASVHILEVLNKIDLWQESKLALSTKSVAVSALKDLHLDRLLEVIDKCLIQKKTLYRITLPVSAGKEMAYLHANGEVITQHIEGDQLYLSVRMDPISKKRFDHLIDQ